MNLIKDLDNDLIRVQGDPSLSSFLGSQNEANTNIFNTFIMNKFIWTLIGVLISLVLVSAAVPETPEIPIEQIEDYGGTHGSMLNTYTVGNYGEGTCANCHTDQEFSATLELSEYNYPATILGWYPGATHIFYMHVATNDSISVGGIQISIADTNGVTRGSVLQPSSSNLAGASKKTKPGTQRVYAEHDSPIPPVILGNMRRFYLGFAWIADTAYAGDLIIDACVVLANGDGTEFGDAVYCSHDTIPMAILLSTEETEIDFNYDNRDTWEFIQDGEMRILNNSLTTRTFHISIISLAGISVTQQTIVMEKGAQPIQMANLPRGLYVISIFDGDRIESHKIIIQ